MNRPIRREQETISTPWTVAESSIPRNPGTWEQTAQIPVHTELRCVTLSLSQLAQGEGSRNDLWFQGHSQLFSLMVSFSSTDMPHHEKCFKNSFVLSFKICSKIGGVSHVLPWKTSLRKSYKSTWVVHLVLRQFSSSHPSISNVKN